MLDSLIKQLEKDLDIEESLATQVPGVYALPLDEGLMIMMKPLEPAGMTFTCDFAPCPEGDNEELYKETLLANLFGQGTKGAIIGLNEENNQLTLIHDYPDDLDYQTFHHTLEDFINTVDFWRAEYRNYGKH